MSKDLVLITGGTGFLGTEVTRAFVDAGYPVRVTTRSLSKVEQWNALNPGYKGKIEWVTVKDVGAFNAFDEVIKDVYYVIHTASPFRYNVADNEKDLLIPAIEGAKNILEAAKCQETVKHLVFTSSFAAHCDVSKLLWPGHTYSSQDWNPTTYEEAAKADDKTFAYCASKPLAERVFWDDKERKFAVTTISPPVVFGPVRAPLNSMAELNQSNVYIWDVINGKAEEPIPTSPIPFVVGVDVRDIAALHVRALTEPSARNARVLAIGWHFFNIDISECARKIFADQPKIVARIRAAPGKDEKLPHFAFDSSLAQKILGRPFIGFEKCIKDTAENLYNLEAKLQRQK